MMGVEIARNVGPDGIEIAYERFGDLQAPPALLIMGVGAQMITWPDGLCTDLVARGLQVIRFENRDAGLSTRFTSAPIPDVPAALAGDLSSVAYRLSDMAADTIGLMDTLGHDSAQLVGASMGGMIAQTIAIEYPERVRSLTSMMSNTGDPTVGHPDPMAVEEMLAGPRPPHAKGAPATHVTHPIVGRG